MKVVITGAGGYIGKSLTIQLLAAGHECIPVKRELLNGKVEKISELLAGTDVVMNLAGAPILKRWTIINKKEIYDSRVVVTQKVVTAIHLLPETKRPKTFITSSAIGIYKNGLIHDESSNLFEDSFVGKLVQDWELASTGLPENMRRVVFRIGLVVGSDSKTIKSMLPPFRFFLGGRIASGKQAFPFIHIDDLISAFMWSLCNPKISGIFNMVAPQNITNNQFTKQLANQLKRPSFFVVPAFVLKMLYSEASSLLIKSPAITPQRLIDLKFPYCKPTIKEALSDIY